MVAGSIFRMRVVARDLSLSTRPVRSRMTSLSRYPLSATVVKTEGIALPVTDRVPRICFPLVFQVLTPVRVDPQDVRAVFRQDPDLFRPDDELIRIGQVEVPRKSRWHSAVGYRVGEEVLVSAIEMRLVDRFPFSVVRGMRPHARRGCAALAGLRGAVEDRGSDHRPGAAPVRELVVGGQRTLLTLAEGEARHEQRTQRHAGQDGSQICAHCCGVSRLRSSAAGRCAGPATPTVMICSMLHLPAPARTAHQSPPFTITKSQNHKCFLGIVRWRGGVA